ncbi:helix-turn-helix domain-containing protein [Iningainema tapete]|uniref:Helix-turn-helix transcriptional regulator n=1 Tax=Iningainema tapete BLCC-T55 TaxID=2748662 RepID=A0A8J7BWJ6_9CYAN|nr:AraC family transcriptional regulator [Iningainema tapete]MBD2771932.1 helix-turn-helix transcriptional regulator [Iningainema tapete BLCC-T55]
MQLIFVVNWKQLIIAKRAIVSDDEPPHHEHLLSSYAAGWDSLHLIYELEPADEMPSMQLSQHLIVITLDDCCVSYMLNGRWQHVDYTKGDVGIFPASQPFPKAQVDREVPLIDLFVEPTTLTRATDAVNAQIELVPQLKVHDPLIQHMGLALKSELEVAGADSRFYAESMATALSMHLIRRYCSRSQGIQNYIGGLPKHKLRKVITYINEHLDQNLNLAELAFLVQISPHYFASLFKQSTGLSPHQYVNKCRIEKAKQLLVSQDLTLVEICHQVGFQNQSHFTRVFRQYTSMTPKVYRDMLF